MRARRALGQFPFVAEQVGEEAVAPLRRRRGPNAFQAAADRVAAFARSKFALPAEALLLDAGRFRLCAYQFRIAGAVGFAEGVTAGDESNCFFVVHSHAPTRLPAIPFSGNRVPLSLLPFPVHTLP